MKINECIEELIKIQKLYGNLDIAVLENDMIKNACYIEIGDDSKGVNFVETEQFNYKTIKPKQVLLR